MTKILRTLRDPDISEIDKRIAVEKWKFNQLPSFYRKEHKQEILEKLYKIQEGII